MTSRVVCLRAGSFLALMVSVIATAGCKEPPVPTFPVSGKVTFQKKALPSGTVTFVPDAGKGNKGKESALGMIGPDGSYTLTTGGRDGAPAGWYKVFINPQSMPKEMPPKGQPLPKPPAINPKYQKADTSGISIEVTDPPKPGAYDIELK